MVTLAMFRFALLSRLGRLSLASGSLLWFLWSGTDGLARLGAALTGNPGAWHEAFELSLAEREKRTLNEHDARLGLRLGHTHGILVAIREHVPPREVVHLIGLTERKQARDLVPIPHLAFPRRLGLALIPLPPDWTPDVDSYLLDFDRGLEATLRAKKTKLAAGSDWSLWH